MRPEEEKKSFYEDETSYYFIKVFTRLEQDEHGWPDLGSQTIWGFFDNLEEALSTVHHNITDLWETCYDYAVIENYYQGICNFGEYRQFFKYDKEKDGYFEIEEPDFMKHFCGICLN